MVKQFLICSFCKDPQSLWSELNLMHPRVSFLLQFFEVRTWCFATICLFFTVQIRAVLRDFRNFPYFPTTYFVEESRSNCPLKWSHFLDHHLHTLPKYDCPNLGMNSMQDRYFKCSVRLNISYQKILKYSSQHTKHSGCTK